MRLDRPRFVLVGAARRSALACLAASAVVACGGAATPPPTTPPPAPAAPPAPPPPDLSAVPDPAGLVLSARWAKPGASLDTVHGWTQLPMPGSEQLTELLTSEAVGPVIDLDRPIDIALALVGSGAQLQAPALAVSAAVKDPDHVKAALGDRYKLVPGDNGVTMIEGLGKPAPHDDGDDVGGPGDTDDDDSSDGSETMRTCELAPAYGDAPTRIVCAPTAKALSELAPWLTRTATRTAATSDLHVEIRVEPLKPTIEAMKGVASAMFGAELTGGGTRSPALRDLLMAFGGDAADFASDVDRATLDVTLGDAAATAKGRLELSGATSLIARLAAGHPERSAEPPAAFWQLPADADFAVFDRGADDATIAHARSLLLDAFGAGFVDEGAKAADVQAVQAALGKLVTGAASLVGGGMDLDAVRKAVAQEGAFGDDSSEAARLDAQRTVDEAVLGWRVVEIDQPSASIAGAVKDLAAAMARPSLVKALRGKDAAAPLLTLRAAPLPKVAGLPAGTSHWVVEVPRVARVAARQHVAGHKDAGKTAGKTAAKEPTPKPLVLHVFVAGDGAKTWAAVGGDEGTTASKLALSLGGTGDKLSSRSDLAALKDGAVGAGGFFTARALDVAPVILQLLTGGSAYRADRALATFDRMPAKGASPVVFTVTAQPPGGDGSAVVTSDVTVPRGAIEDAVAAIIASVPAARPAVGASDAPSPAAAAFAASKVGRDDRSR